MNPEKTRARTTWLFVALLAATASPALANIDLVCPECQPEPMSLGALVDLALTTVLEKGISILLFGAAAVVGVPWLIAGAAVAAFGVPRRFRRR